MSDAEKPNATQAEATSTKPRRRGCLGHCARFWWAYLIALIVVIVVVVPVILLVAVPKIAQKKLDEAELTLDGLTVTQTTPTQMLMSLNSTIRTDGSVHANIAGFEGIMYLEDLEPRTPFARIQFPPTTAAALQTVNVTQTLTIHDVAALTTFNTWLANNETVRVTVEGDTTVRVRGIARNYGVTFKKTLTLAGLNKLAGTRVEPTLISLTPDANGNNFRATVYIPNPSVVSIELGNITFRNYLLGQEVGTIFLDNLTLRPGTNVHPMRATIENGPVIAALGSKPFCEEGGVLPFEFSGESVVNNGEPLPYFADALKTFNQTTEIPIGAQVKKDLDVTIPCGGLGGGNNEEEED
ncbi:hypothetical protein VTJ83DRAFT_5999 [Remersonia thermophila]|uniref:Uncharacterized protein n=1 Tax=Remersonia thermophila TaxID=72144 RepID=A0ABR4D8F3_9PEZI